MPRFTRCLAYVHLSPGHSWLTSISVLYETLRMFPAVRSVSRPYYALCDQRQRLRNYQSQLRRTHT